MFGLNWNRDTNSIILKNAHYLIKRNENIQHMN